MEARDMIHGMDEDTRGNVGQTVMDDDMNRLLQQKWAPMLEGVEDSWGRRSTAIIMEEQMKYIGRMQRRLGESTLQGSVPDLVKFIFPLVRKVWPNLIANNLCSMQPMTSPIGGIFYWDYKYGTTRNTITAGDNMIENFDRNYSTEFVDGDIWYTGTATGTTNGTLVAPVLAGNSMGRPNPTWTATRSGGGTYTATAVAGATTITGDVGGGDTINYTNGAVALTWTTSDVVSVVVSYVMNMENNSGAVPEVNVDIQLDPVKAWSRKLKVLWSSEAADDMRAVLNMNIEPELTAGVASEIGLGIDRELIMAMYNSGTTNTASWDAAVPAGRNQVDHYRNITTILAKVSGGINTATRRGPGNFIVCGPSVEPIFEALHTHGDLKGIYSDGGQGRQAGQGVTGRPQFALPQAPAGYGVYVMGTLQHKWTVIVDPFFPEGKILVGLKGPMFPDSGLVYSPYVALEMTQAFLDPADFSLRKGMRTRYCKKMVNDKFFGIITVTNLP